MTHKSLQELLKIFVLLNTREKLYLTRLARLAQKCSITKTVAD